MKSGFFTLVLFLLLAVPAVAVAQTEREREREANDRDLELRSWNLKLISLRANKGPKSKVRPEQVLAQVQEDFTRIQVVNKALVLSIAEKKPLDFSFVKKSVTQIHKHSSRLNEYLALPDVEKHALEPTSVSNQNQLKLSVLRLGNLIYSFTNNQFFKEPSVIDSEKTVQARRELMAIVELSEQIKKDSERLEKLKP